MTPISEINLEQSTYALFKEWLGGYFDGTTHAVGANSGALFPVASFGFAQSALPQPLNGGTPMAAGTTKSAPLAGITMVFAAGAGKVSRRWDIVDGARQQIFYKPIRLNFWIRSDTANDSARLACLSAAQLLESILANKAETRVLAQNGVHRIRPGTPQPVADTTYILRLLPCAATLKYAVLSQITA